MTTSKFNRSNVLYWMRTNVGDFRDPKTHEVNATALAEAAASAFDADYVNGPLDDPDHWIWEAALEIA